MARTKGSKNLNPPRVPHTLNLTTEGKIEFLATLIIERIEEDLSQDGQLLKRIEREYAAELPAAS
jgi:hypothetical protein